jgi:HK97 family phage major capsid protein
VSTYLDRLNDEFDTITAGIDDILNRAAAESREVTADESQLIERDQSRAEEVNKSIEHYAGIEQTRAKVAATRAKLPPSPTVQRSTVQVEDRQPDPDAELLREFPTAGDYITTIGRALRGDKEAGEKIARATVTQHQTLADNPGIVPRPVLGPVIDLVDNSRPFITSISQKALPAGSFDRPIITQHVAVGVQSAEKQPTESQKLIIGKLPVTAATYAGHLNISRQDIKWTSPGIMQIVADDFATIYADETDQAAVEQFLASLTDNSAIPITDFDAAGISGAIFGAAAATLSSGTKAALPDTLWCSPDVWGSLGGLTTPNGGLLFPSMNPGSTQGNVLGLELVADPHFPAGTLILGPSRFAEWYEDLDGFLSVQEPDVLGQLVGYAGYGAFLNTAPTKFQTLTLPVAPPLGEGARTAAKK